MAVKTRTPLLAVFVIFAAALAGCAAPQGATDADPAAIAKPKVVLAIQPTDNAARIQDSATELEMFLEDRVAADFEIIVPLSNAGVVEALRFGHADVALMGAWPMALAASKADARVVLAEMREVTIGEQAVVAPYYFSYYVVLDDDPVKDLEDLRGKTVAYTSATSTSGYVYPVARLVELGLVPRPEAGKEADPEAFFGNALLAGGYSQAWEALKNGQVDVAVIAGDVKVSLYQEVLASTHVVEKQGPVPSHGVVFARDFDGVLAEETKTALLELKGDHRALMRDLVSGLFVEFEETTTEEHTGPLAEALGLVGFRFSEKIG
ncbi:MAG TPA: phosphate/phosphite/phosphonate ABC transporter substrate-binding protein [Candidatus Thermoplasmatota archaeon]|nr:phosphate/phosphite/phosphonate ABC transporter substrate-binding protein [Candidatus Thermoplasmatota archaeon]